MIDVDILNDLKIYLKHAHPSYIDRTVPETVGECRPTETIITYVPMQPGCEVRLHKTDG